jgi:hypothetical protein
MNQILEAKRYIDNAKEILSSKAKKEDGFYTDKKYVRLAGHSAYMGVLTALDSAFGEKTKKGKRKDVNWYKENLAKTNKKLLYRFLSAYDTLHLALGYDGNLDAKVANAGFENADTIIKWAESKMN